MRTATLTLLTCLSLAGLASADEVTLKGGVKLRGKILSEDKDSIVLRLRGGGKTTLQRKKILKIERSSEPARKPPAKDDATSGGKPALPALGKPTTVAPGIERFDRTVKGTRLWLYRPAKRAGRVPLVVVAPAGSRMIHGMKLGKGDVPEHLPYVRAGFCVVAYAVSGHVAQNATDAQFVAGVRRFLARDGGLDDARNALDYALARLPIDRRRVYAAGHSSAATLALQLAASEPRIKAVAAYAPCTRFDRNFKGNWLPGVEAAGARGVTAYVRRSSPHKLTRKLTVPVFLLGIADDRRVPVAEVTAFAKLLEQTNPKVTLLTAPRGGHYTPMIQLGIPRAIRWMKGLR